MKNLTMFYCKLIVSGKRTFIEFNEFWAFFKLFVKMRGILLACRTFESAKGNNIIEIGWSKNSTLKKGTYALVSTIKIKKIIAF